MDLLQQLKPKFWFSGHMHTKFEAEVIHEALTSGCTQDLTASPHDIESGVDPKISQVNQRAILTEDEGAAVDSVVQPPSKQSTTQGAIATRFLALDKCLPNREFLEVSTT